ncbi:SURF1 family protein [Ferrimonas balearica]|uniref:SURF1 family protein n=1 Tax=Ferrimonas balearica TaxID=44012 RepID=UPI001C99BBCC|nr:SURF1 family protein [Ferrimonas balearica]MBY5994037.1 SURF1 family protein [Ferrimonas balearica]
MTFRVGLALSLTVLAFAVLVKLGLWQLDRAAEKRTLMAQLEARAHQSLSWPPTHNDLAGYRLSLSGQTHPQNSLLLDNQTLDGQVGYRWLLPFEADKGGPWLLLDLGFVPVPRGSRALPELPAVPDRLTVTGRLYRVGHNPLNHRLQAEPGPVTRIQALAFDALSQQWSQSVLDAVLLVEQPSELGFARPWRPINLSPEKHQGYALQWFGLAVGLVLVVLAVLRRGRLQGPVKADRLET